MPPCCVAALVRTRVMALEKTRSQAGFLSPYRREQVVIGDNSATVYFSRATCRQIIKQGDFGLEFK